MHNLSERCVLSIHTTCHVFMIGHQEIRASKNIEMDSAFRSLLEGGKLAREQHYLEMFCSLCLPLDCFFFAPLRLLKHLFSLSVRNRHRPCSARS